MRLIVKWSYGDGCTYSCNETEPVEFESAEAFIVGFEDALKAAFKDHQIDFKFAGREWDLDQFYYRVEDRHGRYLGNDLTLPKVLTVDEWFNNYCQ
jgi:hypothetical protein